MVTDKNRPIYSSPISSPEYERLSLTDEDSSLWADEDEQDCKVTNSRGLNTSLEYIKRREDWNSHQRINRRNVFNRNRRRSTENYNGRYSDDWGQFQSCVSLADASFPEVFLGPKKTTTRNFINSHHAQVERLSDIYVHPSHRNTFGPQNSDEDKKYSWQEIRYILLTFCVVLLSVFFSGSF